MHDISVNIQVWMCNTLYKHLKMILTIMISANTYDNKFKTCSLLRPKKKIVMLPSPDQNLKIGSVGRFFFFFFLRTVRELSFPIFFLQFLNGENLGGMQSKRIYKCFFRPLNTNFSKFFAQIWHFHTHKKKKKKKNRPCFFTFYGRSGEGNITIFWGGPYGRNK